MRSLRIGDFCYLDKTSRVLVGKSTILYQLTKDQPVTRIPIMGKFGPTYYEDLAIYDIDYWLDDNSPPRIHQQLRQMIYPTMKGLIYVVNATIPEFDKTTKHIKQLLINEQLIRDRAEVPLLIYSNKQDLQNAFCVEEICHHFFHGMDDVEIQRHLLCGSEDDLFQIIHAQYQNDMEISKDIIDSICSYSPSQYITGTIQNRKFCILPIIATTNDPRIEQGIKWITDEINHLQGSDCILM